MFKVYVNCVMGNDVDKAMRKVDNIKGSLLEELQKFNEFRSVYNLRKDLMDGAYNVGLRARKNVSVMFVLPESDKYNDGKKMVHAYEGKYVVITPGMFSLVECFLLLYFLSSQRFPKTSQTMSSRTPSIFPTRPA